MDTLKTFSKKKRVYKRKVETGLQEKRGIIK